MARDLRGFPGGGLIGRLHPQRPRGSRRAGPSCRAGHGRVRRGLKAVALAVLPALVPAAAPVLPALPAAVAAPVLAAVTLGLGPARPAAAQEALAVDLRDADIRSFIRLISEQTGRNFIVDSGVSGRVTVVAPAEIGQAALFDIFVNVLELNDLTIVEGSGADRIVRLRGAAELSPGDGGAPRAGLFETRTIPVRQADLGQVLEVVLPLVPGDARITSVPSAGLLVLSDRRENIGRIERLVAHLDAAGAREVEAVQLRNARAEEVVEVIRSLDLVPSGASISANAGTNSVIASGPPEFRSRLRRLVAQLDTPQQQAVSRVVRLNYADAEGLAEVVRQSVAGGEAGAEGTITVVAEPQNNALLISAPANRIEGIAAAVRALDNRPSQVLIEALIFEVSAENFSDLSVQFAGLVNDAIGGGTSFSLDGRASLISLIGSAYTGTVPDPGDGLLLGGAADRRFAALLSALTRERSTRLLSTPAVLALNNREAEIVVAQNVPFVTGRFSTVGDSAIPEQPFQTIQRQDVGLTLKVRPQITGDGTVRMSISQEVSNLTGSASAAGGEITARRMLTTNVIVGDGRVILLGGLMEEGGRLSTERVPGLSTLPVLGNLFRGRSVRDDQRVLLVMLRPRVLRNDREAERLTTEIARKTETLSRRIQPRDDGAFPRVRRVGFPFDGVDLNQPFDSTYVDKAVRERMFPALPPRLVFDVGQ